MLEELSRDYSCAEAVMALPDPCDLLVAWRATNPA
jgi:hypothetical protein